MFVLQRAPRLHPLAPERESALAAHGSPLKVLLRFWRTAEHRVWHQGVLASLLGRAEMLAASLPGCSLRRSSLLSYTSVEELALNDPLLCTH